MPKIEFYETENGKNPVKKFLDDLNPATELPYVLRDIANLEKLGNEARRPLVDSLGKGIYELRTRIIKKQLRILYFFFYDEKIILSHGIPRKEGAVPQADIDTALEHKRDYIERHKRKK